MGFISVVKSLFKKNKLYNLYSKRVESGELVLHQALLLNFIVQRIFRVNSKFVYSLHFTSQIVKPEKLEIGFRGMYSLAVNGGIYIQAINGVKIGENVLIASGVKIISADHQFEANDRKSHQQEKSIEIGNHCWLGANSVILPGVKLGDNVIVGAGSVVTKSFPDNVIVVGNPAKVLRSIER
jgi:acetyltransferase-like isoleucine patch superfamily enzyme